MRHWVQFFILEAVTAALQCALACVVSWVRSESCNNAPVQLVGRDVREEGVHVQKKRENLTLAALVTGVVGVHVFVCLQQVAPVCLVFGGPSPASS